MSIERSLIEHCAPTLAGLKVGSLFSFLAPVCESLHEEIAALNAQLQKKGLTLRLVKALGDRALCYLYRTSQLNLVLSDPDNAAFLHSCGYRDTQTHCVLETLCSRLAQNPEFPHEIGLFLGYPLGDVIGFIENKGKNCLCCGCWKAYTDACSAQKRFTQFGKCTNVYKRLYQAGRPLNMLTVSA